MLGTGRLQSLLLVRVHLCDDLAMSYHLPPPGGKNQEDHDFVSFATPASSPVAAPTWHGRGVQEITCGTKDRI